MTPNKKILLQKEQADIQSIVSLFSEDFAQTNLSWMLERIKSLGLQLES